MLARCSAPYATRGCYTKTGTENTRLQSRCSGDSFSVNNKVDQAKKQRDCGLMLRRQTTIHREGWYYLLIMAVVFGGALFKEVNLLLILAGMLLGPVLLNWQAVGTNLRGLRVERKLPRGLSAGDWLSVSLRLSNARRRLGVWAVVVEEQIQRITTAAGTIIAVRCSAPTYFFRTCPRDNRARAPIVAGCWSAAAIGSAPCGFPRGFPLGCFRARSRWARARR